MDSLGPIGPSRGGTRAQSSLIGYILVIAMIIGAVVTLVALGSAAISDTQGQAEAQQVEHTMTLFDSRAALVALGDARSQTIPLPNSAGSYYTDDEAGWMRVNVTNTTNGNTTTIANVTLGALIYEDDDTVVAYQGGGVWRLDNNNQSRMISPPEFHYQDQTLTLPIISIEGSTSVSGGALSIQRNGTAEQVFPNRAAGDVNPVENGEIRVTVRSDYYQGWADYFEDRTEGDAERNHSHNMAHATLTIPSNRANVSGGVVSGSAGTTLVVENNAIADSYNSSNGDYTATQGDDTYILVAGNLRVENNGIIDGDVEAGGDVNLQNNAEVHGYVAYGGSYTAHHTAIVDGWTASNGSVTTPLSVAGLIDARAGDLTDSNDNASESSDIDALETGGACSPCELEAGEYYLDSLTLQNGDVLELDASSDEITLVVDGDITVDNNGIVDVDGNNRVNVYTEGDVTFNQDSRVNVAGDRSPNFWIYMDPAATFTASNNAEIDGVIYGPGSATTRGIDLNLVNTAHIYGAVVGDASSMNQNFNIHYDEALASVEPVQRNGNIPVVTYLHISRNRVNITSG